MRTLTPRCASPAQRALYWATEPPWLSDMFGADWDIMSDVTKSRLYGFHDVVDSEAMFSPRTLLGSILRPCR
jgi:hypothetical protein